MTQSILKSDSCKLALLSLVQIDKKEEKNFVALCISEYAFHYLWIIVLKQSYITDILYYLCIDQLQNRILSNVSDIVDYL